jgi:hypothetical protein
VAAGGQSPDISHSRQGRNVLDGQGVGEGLRQLATLKCQTRASQVRRKASQNLHVTRVCHVKRWHGERRGGHRTRMYLPTADAVEHRKKSSLFTNVKGGLFNCGEKWTTQRIGRVPHRRHEVCAVLGKVIWVHEELRMALIERCGGFTVGSVEEGRLTLGGCVEGEFRRTGPTVVKDIESGALVTFFVEAEAMTEDEANELLGIVRT